VEENIYNIYNIFSAEYWHNHISYIPDYFCVGQWTFMWTYWLFCMGGFIAVW